MSFSEYYGPPDAEAGRRIIHAALDRGVTLFDTAFVFGSGANEALLGEVLGHRDDVVISTKFGGFAGDGGRPHEVRAACDAALQRLRVDRLDLFGPFRIDRSVPSEETWDALAELAAEGKIAALSLCEVAEGTLRRLHARHPVAVVHGEYSLWTRDPDVGGVSIAAEELDVGFIATSPLGRGMLSGAVTDLSALHEDDSRRRNPRFQSDAFPSNRVLAQRLGSVAADAGMTAAQLCIGWLLSRAGNLVPVPGARTLAHLGEVTSVPTIDARTLAAAEAAVAPDAVRGDRYSSLASVEG